MSSLDRKTPRMTPFVEQKRTTQEQQEQRQDRGFEHVAAPVLSKPLEMYAFSPLCRRIADLHVSNPGAFVGISHSDGTNLPNAKTVFMYSLFGLAA